MSWSFASARIEHDETDDRLGIALRPRGPWTCWPRMAEQARPCDGGTGRCAEPARAAPGFLRQFRLAFLRPRLLASGEALPSLPRTPRAYRHPHVVRRAAHAGKRGGG